MHASHFKHFSFLPHMNKFIVMIIFAVLLIGSGVIYAKFYRPESFTPIAASGNVITIPVRILENKWVWEPNILYAKVGDKVILKIFNEDSYDHGFALETFGISTKLSPKIETVIEFIASKEGTFGFYCSVPCGEGHYQQTGQFIITK